MSSSNGNELLATILIILCLFLLWCWWKSPHRACNGRSGFISVNGIDRPQVPSGAMIRANLPDLHFRNLNETVDRGNFRIRHPPELEGQDLVAVKWLPEGMTNGKSVELDARGYAVTDPESVYEVRTRELGPDIVAPYRQPLDTRRNSHSMDGLINSTLTPAYGQATGYVTM